MMTISKEHLTKYIKVVWEDLSGGEDMLTMKQVREKVLENNDQFIDYHFLKEEVQGKQGFGITFEEFSELVCGNSKL